MNDDFNTLLIFAPNVPEWFESDNEDQDFRFFAWRYYYAKQMMEIINGDSNHENDFQ